MLAPYAFLKRVCRVCHLAPRVPTPMVSPGTPASGAVLTGSRRVSVGLCVHRCVVSCVQSMVVHLPPRVRPALSGPYFKPTWRGVSVLLPLPVFTPDAQRWPCARRSSSSLLCRADRGRWGTAGPCPLGHALCSCLAPGRLFLPARALPWVPAHMHCPVPSSGPRRSCDFRSQACVVPACPQYRRRSFTGRDRRLLAREAS